MSEKFIMVSLKDEKAKKLAEVISNDTARKISDYLSDHEEATLNEISKDLNIPLSTVDYNIKNLLKSSLIESKEFKWSPKGRHIDIYKLANKHIIISTKKSSEIQEILKQILPLGIIGLIIGSLIEFIYRKPIQEVSSPQLAMKAAEFTESMQQVTITNPHYGLWFILGILCAILIFIITRRLK